MLHRSNRDSVMAALRLAIFVLRFVFVMAGVAILWERTEGGIEVCIRSRVLLSFYNNCI